MDAVIGSSALLSLILGWIYVPRSPTSSPESTEVKLANKALFSCSRVNRLWHGESCRLLWRNLSNLSHVTRLLRPDKALLSPYERKRVTSGLISLERFSHYSRWIFHLSCSIVEYYPDLKDAFLLSKGTLFPCLENLNFVKIDQRSSMVALALLGPRLEKITFERTVLSDTIVLIMSRLDGIQLQELLMPENIPATDDRLHLLNVLRGQKSLTQLSLHPHWVDLDVFYAIGSLPRLFNLEMVDFKTLPPAMNTICDSAVLGRLERRGSMFLSLKQLTFGVQSFVWMKLFNTIFTDITLSEVALDLAYLEEENSESAVILTSGRGLASLELISVRVGGNNVASTPPVTARTLQPLSKCGLLQVLDIRMARVPRINDRELLSLAKNWPNLTELLFSEMTCVNREDIYGLSMNVLGEIPALCPKISFLSLPCSSSVEFESSRKVRARTLISLDLGPSFLLDSQLADWSNRLMTIAAYLAIILPPACTLKFDVEYSKLIHQISHHEWSRLIAAHQQTTSQISNYRAVVHMAHNFQIQLDTPAVSSS